MIKDLNALYDPDDKEGGPGTETKPAPARRNVDELTAPSFSAYSPVQEGVTSTVPVQDYTNFLSNGVYTTRDINLERGQQQSVVNKLARRIGNIVPNMAASMMEMMGNVGSLAGEWGDNRDYDNAFTRAAEAIKNPFGEVYARTDRSTLGNTLADPGWWIDNIAGAVELVAPFAAAGAGVGGLMDRIASGASDILKLGAEGTQIARGAGQLGTSAFMSYTMAASGGARVFQNTYQNQFQKLIQQGKSPDEADAQAKHIAAQSAATTVQLGTLIGTALNAFTMATYFRRAESEATGLLREQLKPLNGESQEQAIQRVLATGADSREVQNALNPSQAWWHKGLEALKMGAEMQQLQFGEKTGEELGKEGRTKGFFDQLGELENYFDRVGDKDGFLAFATGAAAGMGLHYLQHNILPSKLIDKVLPDGTPVQKTNPDGTPKFTREGNPVFEKQFVTPRSYDATMTTRRYTTLRDALAEDYKNLSQLQADYSTAMSSGNQVEADRLANEMMNITHTNAVRNGITEPLANSFREMGEKSPELKEKADKAIGTLGELQNIYDGLQKRYGLLYSSNQGMKDLVDMVFARKADLHVWDKMLKEHEEQLRKDEAEQDNNDLLLDPEKFDASINQYQRQWESTQEVHKRIKGDYDKLSKAIDRQDTKTMLELVRKYRAAGMHEEDLQGAVHNLTDRMQRVVDQTSRKVQEAQDNLFNSTGYNDWLQEHPNGTFTDFVKDIQQRYGNSLELSTRRADIEESRQRHDIARAELAEIEKPRSLPKFARKAADWIEKLRRDTEETEKKKTEDLINRAKDKGTVDRIARLQIQEMAKRYAVEAQEHSNKASEVQAMIDRLQAEYDNYSAFKEPIHKAKLYRQIKELKAQKQEYLNRARKAMALAEDHSVTTNTPDTPVPVDELDKTNLDIENEPEEDPLKEDTASPVPEENPAESPAQVVPHETPTPEPVPVEVVIPVENDPVHEALMEIHGLQVHPDVASRAEDISMDLLSGDISFSLDLLKPEVEKGLISQADASKLLLAIQRVADVQENQEIHEEVAEFLEAEDLGTEPIPHIDGSNISKPDTEPTNAGSEDELIQTIPIDRFHSGRKIDNVLSVANSTIAYTEHYIQDKGKSTGKYVMIADQERLNENTNQDVLKAGKLMPGHPVRFEVDETYNGGINYDDTLAADEYGERLQRNDKFENYTDGTGRIDKKPAKTGNVPIKVVDATNGKTVGYVRRLDWVTAQYPNATGKEQYRNVQTLYDEDGNPVPIQESHVRDIMALRDAVVAAYNSGRKSLDGTIESKGTGQLILNRETNQNTGSSKVVPKYARAKDESKSMLPDKSLTLAIINENQAWVAPKIEFSKPKAFDKIDMPNGTVVAMLPAPNGEHVYTQLVGQKLVEGTRRSALNSVARAIELYLMAGSRGDITEELKKLQDNTGFDITSHYDLKRFINQYFTYTQAFDHSALSANLSLTSSAKPSFLFNIRPPVDGTKATIEAGFSFSGLKEPIYAKLVDGKLNQEFRDMLEQGLATRSRSVVYEDQNFGVKGINSKGAFKDAVYTANGWRHPEYESYNEYVKSFSKTAVYGRNQLPDGTYVYTANPQIEFKVHSVASDTVLQVKPNETARKVELPPVPENKEEAQKLASQLDDLMTNFSLSPGIKRVEVPEIGTAPDNSGELSPQSLEKLYNFTPEAERNGKTVKEVYDNLTQRGHTFLPEGFNPFTRCL